MKKLLILAPIGMVVAMSTQLRNVKAEAGPRQIEITAKRFEYLPSEITLKKGEPVVLVVKSVDVAHGLKFPELNLDTKVGKGETGEIRFTPERLGDFTGRCSVFCGGHHGAMKLTMHVVQ